MFLALKWYNSVKQAQYNMQAFLLFSSKRKFTKKKKICQTPSISIKSWAFQNGLMEVIYKLI